MSEINLEFKDITEEWEQAQGIYQWMKDWASLIYDSSTRYNKPVDESLNDINQSQLSITFKCDWWENE